MKSRTQYGKHERVRIKGRRSNLYPVDWTMKTGRGYETLNDQEWEECKDEFWEQKKTLVAVTCDNVKYHSQTEHVL